jgi:hypothetical protein
MLQNLSQHRTFFMQLTQLARQTLPIALNGAPTVRLGCGGAASPAAGRRATLPRAGAAPLHSGSFLTKRNTSGL